MPNRCRVMRLIPTVASVIALSFIAISVAARAQSPNQAKPTGVKSSAANASATRPDFTGIWRGRNAPEDFNHPEGPGLGRSGGWKGKKNIGGGFGFQDAKSEPPSMLPWAQAKYNAIREGSAEYMQVLKDVTPDGNCIPPGFPWELDRAQLEPFQIVQTPKKLVMLFTPNAAWRQIFLDGRKNPEGAPDSFMGYSTGKWEGDTLVVETTGINDLTWIDILGHPHSDALRVEERIRRVAQNRLDIDVLFDDPKTYTKPWKGKKIYYLQGPEVDIEEDFSCDATWGMEYPEKVRKTLGETKPQP